MAAAVAFHAASGDGQCLIDEDDGRPALRAQQDMGEFAGMGKARRHGAQALWVG